VTESAPRLAPRSAVAAADLELLRVARTNLDELEAPSGGSFADRLRGLAAFLPTRPEPEGPEPVVRIGEGR
jgi:hypothetical protein